MGFPRFINGHYIYVITQRLRAGKLFGSMIYQVVEARLEVILNQESSVLYKVGKQRVRETKYLGVFNAMDVTDFYFSYDIDLTHHLETTALQMALNNGVDFDKNLE